MGEQTLHALRAMNPLGFLAALGVLAVADRMRPGQARLRWTDEVDPAAVLHGDLDRDGLVELILEDRDGWQPSPALDHRGPDGTLYGDVKFSPEELQAWIDACAAASGSARPGYPDAVGSQDRGRALGLVGALVADGSFAEGGKAKPTDLHFTAGRQQFLEMARDLRDGLTAEHIEEALFGPWRYDGNLPTLKWDVTDDRQYVFAAVNPASDAKWSVPGSEWLALMGLVFLPVTSRPRRARTTACSGDWKSGRFTWPVWDAALDAREVMTLLSLPELCADSVDRSLAARGVRRVYRSRISRSDQGGYGSFRPTVAELDA